MGCGLVQKRRECCGGSKTCISQLLVGVGIINWRHISAMNTSHSPKANNAIKGTPSLPPDTSLPQAQIQSNLVVLQFGENTTFISFQTMCVRTGIGKWVIYYRFCQLQRDLTIRHSLVATLVFSHFCQFLIYIRFLILPAVRLLWLIVIPDGFHRAQKMTRPGLSSPGPRNSEYCPS